MQTTYQSKCPVTAKITKKPESDWEIGRGHCEILITGPRLSFASIWRPGKRKDKVKGANDADIIVPLLEQNKAAIDLIQQCYTHAAKCCTPSVDPKGIAKKERKLTVIPLGTKLLDEDGDVVVKDGVEQLAYNDGHLVLSTYNSFNSPTTYVDMAGVPVVPVKQNNPETDFDVFEKVMDPSGVEAHELVGTGNNVRVKISMTAGKDFDGNPKVWISMMAVQFWAEDEKLSKGGARGTDTSEFGAVNPPAGDGFETEQPTAGEDPFGADASNPFG